MATVADREAGAIYVLVCYPSGQLAQPCVITELDEQTANDRLWWSTDRHTDGSLKRPGW
jgi:hypothetical protein